MTMPDRVKLWPEGNIGWYRATTVPGMSGYKDTEYVRADIADTMHAALKVSALAMCRELWEGEGSMTGPEWEANKSIVLDAIAKAEGKT